MAWNVSIFELILTQVEKKPNIKTKLLNIFSMTGPAQSRADFIKTGCEANESENFPDLNA